MTDGRRAVMAEDLVRRQAERLLAAHALPEGDVEALVRVLGRCQARRLSTGEILCREGDKDAQMFFLLEGRVRVIRKDHAGRERDIGTWYAPAIIGTMALLGDAPRLATCTAGAPVLVAALDGHQARKLLGEPTPDAAHLRWLLLSSLTETLANVTDRLRALLGSGDGPELELAALQALLEGIPTAGHGSL